MNQISKFLVFGLLSLTALTSCDKKSDLSSNGTKPEKVSYVSSIAINTFEHLNGEGRAIVKSNGYAVPKLDLNKAEFESSDKLPAHWSVLGGGEHEEVSTFKALEKEAEGAVGNALYITTTEPKEIKMYCDISLTNVKQKSAMFALGGVISVNKQFLEFIDIHSPNAKIQGIKTGDKQIKREIPLMTEVKAFDKLLAPAGSSTLEKSTFNPRGALVGLCFVNKLNKKISIKKIILEKDNALYFEGKFSLQKGIKNTDFLLGTSVSQNEMLKFIGMKANEDIEAPVVSGDLEPLPSTTPIDLTLKNSLALFHIWGMPKDKSKKLKIKVVFTKGNDLTELTTNSFEIKTPTNGFEEGKAYRKTLVINEDALNEPSTPSIVNPNPLMYVAEYDLNRGIEQLGYGTNPNTIILNNPLGISKNYKLSEWLPHPTGFRNSYDFPVSIDDTYDVTAPHQPENTIAYFTYDEAYVLFNHNKPSWLDNYVLPTKEQWLSILPETPRVRFDSSQSDSFPAEECQVGNTPKQSYDSEYITIAEDGSFVTYALRFKGTNWESAWRYSWDDTRKALVVKCIDVHEQHKSLYSIYNDTSFFTGTNVTVRIFPAYNYRDYDNSNVYGFGDYGHYWSSSLGISSESASYAVFDSEEVGGIANTYSLNGLAVRPFKKNL